MDLNKDEKIKKYHSDEVLLILFISASDLSQYGEDDLINFAEDIEGRIEVLFDPVFLLSLNQYLKVNPNVIADFERLRDSLINLYGSKWHQKLKEKNADSDIAIIAKRILNELDISFVEPKSFKDSHFNIDWT